MPLFEKIKTSLPYANGRELVNYTGRDVAVKSGDLPQAMIQFREPDAFQIFNYNVNSSNATENSQRIPDGTTKLEFQARTAVDVRWSFQSGNAFYSLNPYFTIKAGGSYFIEYPNQGLFGETIYFASASSTVVEMRAHVGWER